MVISFDPDDTLIPSAKSFPTEPQNRIQKILRLEKIRIGTIELLKDLKAQDHKIYIYTTSLRSTIRIWWTFYFLGIKLDKIINQTLHDRILGKQAGNYSKYPPAFSIDFHIDDSHGVQLEGERFNFKTIIVEESDILWTETIRKKINLSES